MKKPKLKKKSKPLIRWVWKYDDGQLGDETCVAFIKRPTGRHDGGRYVRVSIQEL